MSDPQGRPKLGDFVANREERLFHVGRLDADTEGLILLTNDGDLAHRLSHPSYEVPKTYLVEVAGPVPRDLGKRLRAGIELDDGLASVDSFKVVDARPGKALLELVLHDGRNRVVRRMLAAAGHPVEQLVRTQVGPIRLGDLRPGRTRVLGQAEVGALMAAAGMDPAVGVAGLRRLVGRGRPGGPGHDASSCSSTSSSSSRSPSSRHLVGRTTSGRRRCCRRCWCSCVTGWMYGGYAWLTNQLPPGGVAAPRCFSSWSGWSGSSRWRSPSRTRSAATASRSGWPTSSSSSCTPASSRSPSDSGPCARSRGWRRRTSRSALVVVAAGFVDGPARLGAVAAGHRRRGGAGRAPAGRADSPSSPAHFVERHGLIVIVALGETVVALGRRPGASAGARSDGRRGRARAAALRRAVVGVLRRRRGPRRARPRRDRARNGAAWWRCSRSAGLRAAAARDRPVAAGLHLAIASRGGRPGRRPRGCSPVASALYLGGEAIFRVSLGIRPVALAASPALPA